MYKKSEALVNTTEGSKWIFVLSTTRSLYVGQVLYPTFLSLLYIYSISIIQLYLLTFYFLSDFLSRKRRVRSSIRAFWLVQLPQLLVDWLLKKGFFR